MKYLIACFLLLSTAAFSFDFNSEEDTKTNIQSYYIQPCSSWSYSTDARGYVCTFTGMSINVPESYSVERALDNLERRIEALEQKIRDLENQQ